MSDSLVDLTITDGVARLTLNRPDKRNALTDDFIRQINGAVERVAKDSTVRVFVLAASGTVFCAGMDLGQMQQRAQADNSEELWLEDSRILCDTFRAIFSLNMPTVAVVQGPAVAGGMGLVLSCDLTIASDNAFFALPEPQRGITAAMVTPLLLYRVGTNTANELLLGGGRMPAPRAQQAGLCHQVVSTNALAETETALVRSILNGSRDALRLTKQHVIRCAGADVLRQLAESVDLSAEARKTSDAREGLQAFLEKRKAHWIPE